MSTEPPSRGARDGAAALARPATLKTLLEDYERALILKALEEAGGHQRRAAAALGILPTTLNEKMRRLQLRPSAPAARRARP